MSGAVVLVNKKDNTFTVVIEKDFYRWAGDPTLEKNSFGIVTKGQSNIAWLERQLKDFLNSQWEGF